MKKHLLTSLLALLLVLATILPASATPASAQQVQPLLDGILQAELTRCGADSLQGWIDGPLAQNAGQGSEWYILALSQLGGTNALSTCDLTAYRDSLTTFLAQDATYGASTRQKYALCMLASGGDAGVAEVAETTIGQQGVMSWIYGLHLLNNGCLSSTITPQGAALHLVDLQLPDGGWAIMGQTADVDVTAMALQALAPHRDDPAVAAAVDGGVALLAQRQQGDGGFVSMGQPNPESAAQVMIALCGLGIDPLADQRFMQNGNTLLDAMLTYQLADGSFCHTLSGDYSAAATMQVFDALAAYVRFESGLPGLYLLDGAATQQMQGESAAPAVQNASPDFQGQQGEATNGQAADGQSSNEHLINDQQTNTPLSDTLPSPDSSNELSITDISPASSIGIIGGADGPTAIFVTSSHGWKSVATVAIVALAVVWCLSLLLRRKRNLKSYLVVALVAAALLGLVAGLDIQSPESYYSTAPAPTGEIIGSITMDIRCDALAATTSGAYIPADGIILPMTTFPLHAGDTAYDLLTEAARQHRLHLDASGSEGMRYISGLNHLYEQAYGELSGWMYFVNGQSASQSCDQYPLADGDHISWQYTLEMGNDLH